jgi:predicted enzyme related to lactoylglutathione lyase
VEKAVEIIKSAGGRIITEPFDIKIGKCAVIEDPWSNQYVILDSTKGTFITDNEDNVIGQNS